MKRRKETRTKTPRTNHTPYETLLYRVDDTIATITLNRPDRLNTIVPPMPDEIEAAIHRAVADATVMVIVMRGAGRAF